MLQPFYKAGVYLWAMPLYPKIVNRQTAELLTAYGGVMIIDIRAAKIATINIGSFLICNFIFSMTTIIYLNLPNVDIFFTTGVRPLWQKFTIGVRPLW